MNTWRELDLAKNELEEMLLIRDNMWKQQPEVFWLKEGDRNTKNFHQALQRRRTRNSIFKLSVQGMTYLKPNPIKSAIFNHFKSQFFRRDFDKILDAKGVLTIKIINEDNSFL